MLHASMRPLYALPLLIAGLFGAMSNAQDVPPLTIVGEPKPAAADWTEAWSGQYWTGRGPGHNGTACTVYAKSLNFDVYPCIRTQEPAPTLRIDRHADGVLHVSHRSDTAYEWIRYVNSRVYLVRWGDRRYIVPDSQIASFVERVRVKAAAIAHVPDERPSEKQPDALKTADDWVHRNVGPRFLYSFAHVDDLHKPAFGLPEVPGGWSRFMHHEPVVATITAVSRIDDGTNGPEHPRSFDVNFDVGPDTPLFEGQELFWHGLMGHVRDIDTSHATAQFVLPPESAAASKSPGVVPCVGDTVATLARDSVPLDYWPHIEPE